MKSVRFLLVLAGALLWGQVQLPDSTAARRFAEWLAVFDAGDSARLKKFLEESFPSQSLERAMNARRQSGGFDLEKLEEANDSKIVCIAKGRASGRDVRLTMTFEPAEPHRITSVTVRPIRPGDDAPARPQRKKQAESSSVRRMSESEALAALRAELGKEVAAGQFSGAVLVAKNGNPIFTRAYGLADREKKIPNKADTKFRIGSMNKMFTAVAIAQLAQAGKLQFTDPLRKYLTDYPNPEVASKVTIHHLLTHTGGTGDFFGPEFNAHRKNMRDLKDYVALFGKPISITSGSTSSSRRA